MAQERTEHLLFSQKELKMNISFQNKGCVLYNSLHYLLLLA